MSSAFTDVVLSDKMSSANLRLTSLDALRGFDMIWIIGLEQAMRGLCVLFPGGQDWWFKRQFHHVPWDGLAFYDTIFPLFIFIAGVSFCLLF